MFSVSTESSHYESMSLMSYVLSVVRYLRMLVKVLYMVVRILKMQKGKETILISFFLTI